MKEIKIRFIKRGKSTKDYLIQKKTWLGWKYITYESGSNWGCVDTLYCKDTKEELLHEVLEFHYRVDKRFVTIIEYPMLKRY